MHLVFRSAASLCWRRWSVLGLMVPGATRLSAFRRTRRSRSFFLFASLSITTWDCPHKRPDWQNDGKSSLCARHPARNFEQHKHHVGNFQEKSTPTSVCMYVCVYTYTCVYRKLNGTFRWESATSGYVLFRSILLPLWSFSDVYEYNTEAKEIFIQSISDFQ